MANRSLCEAFVKLGELVIALDMVPITKFDGCWEHRIDEHWEVALNGHDTPQKCSHGTTVEPFHCYIQYNGFPAAILNPYGGTIVMGQSINEDAFIAAIEQAIVKCRIQSEEENSND